MIPTVRDQIVNRISAFSDLNVPESYRDHRAMIEETADAILAGVRAALLYPEIADDIASEMFLHGYEGELTQRDTVAPIALGVVIGHLFGECPTCAEGEVRRVIRETASHE